VGSDSTLLLILNSYHDVVSFKLPEAVGGRRWVRLIDTNDERNEEIGSFDFGHEYEVTGRSLLLFILEPTRTRGQHTDAERSFQHVMQAFESVTTSPIAFPTKAEAWGGDGAPKPKTGG
jgi:isoamylase